jgi:predicted nucleotidyltransferase
MTVQIAVDREQVEAFCRKWKVKEFSIFGSAIRNDFRPDSDVDVMVVFEEGEHWDLFDLVYMRDELKEIFGREVDMVEKRTLRNPFRKHHILNHREVIYAR